MSASPPFVMNTFVPLSTYSPPSLRAVVRCALASEPALGSVSPNAASRLPDAMSGRKRFFCSSVPYRRIGNVPSAVPANASAMPAHTLESSSVTMHMFVMPYPLSHRPSYSTGISTRNRSTFASSWTMSHGNVPSASYFARTGRTFSSAIVRARSRMVRCSSVRW